jgi:hypothetical protein
LSKNFASFECLNNWPLTTSQTLDLEHELHSISRLVEKKSEKPKTLISFFVSGLTHYEDAFPEVLSHEKDINCIAS